MYYSRGNYEAFAKPQKPKGADRKSAYIIGSGFSALAAACFLVRDGKIKGEHIHILEKNSFPGGTAAGYTEIFSSDECLWELLRSVPTEEDSEISVLDECYRLTKAEKDTPGCFAMENCGEALYNHEDKLPMLRLTKQLLPALLPESSESQLSLALKRRAKIVLTKFKPSDSLIAPMVKYLENHGVRFEYSTEVKDIIFEESEKGKLASKIIFCGECGEESIDLIQDDLVFITAGYSTENAAYGDQSHAPVIKNEKTLFSRITEHNPEFGETPEPDIASPYEAAEIYTLDEKIPGYISRICGRDPFCGRDVSGGLITIRDSAWKLSFAICPQPRSKRQSKAQINLWLCGLESGMPGNFVKKPMKDCTGAEICEEWLKHIGVPEDKAKDMADSSADCRPVILPAVKGFFKQYKPGERPKIHPESSLNFAFIGQLTENEGEAVYSPEYAVRTAMEAVYGLLGIDRAVPET